MECMIAQYVKKILVCQLFQVFGSCRGRQQDRAYPQRLFLGRGNGEMTLSLMGKGQILRFIRSRSGGWRTRVEDGRTREGYNRVEFLY